jgi:hypothetical protein
MTSSQEAVVDVGYPADRASTDALADEHLGGGLVGGRLVVSTRAILLLWVGTKGTHPAAPRSASVIESCIARLGITAKPEYEG